MNFHFINIYHGTFTIKLKFKTYYIKIFKNLNLNLWCKKMEGEGKRDEGGGGVGVRFVSFLGQKRH